MDVNAFAVEIECHFDLPFWTAGLARMRLNKVSAGSSVGSWGDELAGEGAGEEGGRELLHLPARLG